MIQSEKVTDIFLDCLYQEDEDSTNHKLIEGILCNYGLNPIKIENHRKSISEMVDNLPEDFKDGWSFLNLCYNKNMEQWTGVHRVCEQLLLLGLAIGRLEYLVPRELWKTMPGQLPYIRVLGEGE